MFALKPLNVPEKVMKGLRIPLLVLFLCPFILMLIYYNMPVFIKLISAAAAVGAVSVLFFKLEFYSAMATNSVLGYILSVLLSALFFILFQKDNPPLLNIALTLIVFNCLNTMLSYFFKFGCDGKLHPKNMLYSSFGAAALAFTLFIYLPSDSFINNLKDFNFAYQDFIFFMLIPFFALIIFIDALALLFNEKVLNLYLSLLAGINLCVFIQYMFFNSRLGLLDGETVNWDEHTGYSVLTLILLLVFLAAPFVFQFIAHKLWRAVVKKIPLFIGIVEAISLAVLLVLSEGQAFRSNLLSLSGEEQYTVSPENNIITIVLDAVDNEYIKSALVERPEMFEGYEDFTIYTNTCSYFDSTFQSFTQIYSGYEELPIYEVDQWNKDAWSTDRSVEFFKRFHDAGYKMNFYVDTSWDLSLLEGRVDNIEQSTLNNTLSAKMGVVGDFNRLTAYRALPFMFKRYFSVEHLDINRNLAAAGSFNFYNEDFEQELDTMSLADNGKNYFIVEHTWGAHTPFDKGDNFMDTTEYILGIVRKYLDNLKELDAYDNSTIIIMADHGSHNLGKYPNSTPMFMIKEAGRRSEKIALNNAPIYYTDLMATYLADAGLYREETDRELFGSSIYDFKNGDQRERIAHYRVNDPDYPPSNISAVTPSFGYNVIYSYKFVGDTEDLLEATKQPPLRIDHMLEDAS